MLAQGGAASEGRATALRGRRGPGLRALTLSLACAGEAGHQVVDLLKKNPAVAVPVILARLTQKDEEWCGAPLRSRPRLSERARRAGRQPGAPVLACMRAALSCTVPPRSKLHGGRVCWAKLRLERTVAARCPRRACAVPALSRALRSASPSGGEHRSMGARGVCAGCAVPADAQPRARGRAGAR